MKKFFILVLALCLILAPEAYAAVRIPSDWGVLTDEADVLSAGVAADVAEYAERFRNATELDLKVVLVHFLDGMQPQAYADLLMEKWNCGADTVLLLGAAGEDSYTVALGSTAAKKLGSANAGNLLYTSSDFGRLFENTEYDQAVTAFFNALNSLACKQCGADVDITGLFGNAAVYAGYDGPLNGELWNGFISSIGQVSGEFTETWTESGGGLAPFEWVLIAVLVLIVISQSDPVKKSRRRGGCLGRLFAGGVIAVLLRRLFGRLFGKRY